MKVLLLAAGPLLALGLPVDFSRATGYAHEKDQARAKSFVHHLGTIKDARGKVTYRVVAKFWTVQAALALHGHSAILFYDNRGREVATYKVGLPEELPTRLANNMLYFTYVSKRQVHAQRLGASLPPMLCVSPVSCYTKENE